MTESSERSQRVARALATRILAGRRDETEVLDEEAAAAARRPPRAGNRATTWRGVRPWRHLDAQR